MISPDQVCTDFNFIVIMFREHNYVMALKNHWVGNFIKFEYEISYHHVQFLEYDIVKDDISIYPSKKQIIKSVFLKRKYIIHYYLVLHFIKIALKTIISAFIFFINLKSSFLDIDL